MRRFARLLKWVAGIVIGLPVVLILVVLIVANIAPGQRLIETLAARFSGGMVAMQGLHGRFPDALRLNHLAVTDAKGAWLTLDGVVLDWSPLALLHLAAHVDLLQADRIAVARLPEASEPAKPAAKSSGGGMSLPVSVRLDRLHVGSLDLAAPVAGVAASASIDGKAVLQNLQQGSADLAIRRLDGDGQYTLHGTMDAGSIAAQLAVHEPAQNAGGGLIAGIAKLPDLGGPIGLDARIQGRRNAEAVTLALAAGPLRADVGGTVDLVGQAAALDVQARAPAMQPRADLSWQSIAIDAHLRGPFTKPDATGTVRVAGLDAGGAGIGTLSADVQGNAGAVQLRAVLDGLHVPGPKPDLFAAAPLHLDADARLDSPARPVHLRVDHPLLNLDATAETGGALRADAHLVLADLEPLAAAGGVALQGQSDVVAHVTTEGTGPKQATRMAVDGTVAATGGMPQIVGLLGRDAHIGATALLDGQTITIERAKVDGATAHLDATGQDANGTLRLDWQLALTDLSKLAAQLDGALKMTGHAEGAQTDLALNTTLDGTLGANGIKPGPLHATLQADGLPSTPDATLKLDGTLDRAPLLVDASVHKDDKGSLQLRVQKFAWKRNDITGDFALPAGQVMPAGQAKIVLHLADLQPFIGQPIGGDIDGQFKSDAAAVKLDLRIANAGLPTAHVAGGTVRASVADPMGKRVVAAHVQLDGIAAAGMQGAATLDAAGPQTALALKLQAALHNLMGADAHLATAATLDLPKQMVALQTLVADWHGEDLRLLGPTQIGFGEKLGFTPLRLGLGTATITAEGSIKPQLNLTATVRNVTPALAKPFAPDVQADGQIGADARLGGTLAAPTGTVKLMATGLHMRTGPAAGLPPANLQASADLRGTSANLDAKLNAGANTHLAVTGTVPLSKTGAIDLRSTGSVDLALLDPILTAQGRRARGHVVLDLAVAGTAAAPRPTGTVRLADVEVQDFVQGLHITAINATVQGDGSQLRLAQFTGRAGPGTIGGSGTIGVMQPDIPLDLHFTANDAQPLAADRLTANLDADIRIGGAVKRALSVGGMVKIRRATINIPDHLPSSVAVLDVHKPGDKPAPPPSKPMDIALDLTLNAPGNAIFVRGHGLDAVLGGKLHLGGNATAPQIGGGFDMQRGTFSLAGTTLNFVRGRVGFNGMGVTNKIDPSLDFQAESNSGGVLAKLLVGGYASAPKITLESEPTLPQDEVLAHLLFGTGTQQLGPLQIAGIAEALASISGVGGSGPGVLDRIRNGLGLDRLSMGSDSGNSIANQIPDLDQRRSQNGDTASIQAGRYVANGVYVGAKQGTSGTDTQAQVQIDITKRLKAETDLGAGRGANTVGLTYQFEY